MSGIPAKIEKVIEHLEHGKHLFITVVYQSGRITHYYHPYFTVPEPIKHFMRNAYVYTVSPEEKLFKANHD